MLKSPRIPAESPPPLTIARTAAQDPNALMLWAGMVIGILGAP